MFWHDVKISWLLKPEVIFPSTSFAPSCYCQTFAWTIHLPRDDLCILPSPKSSARDCCLGLARMVLLSCILDLLTVDAQLLNQPGLKHFKGGKRDHLEQSKIFYQDPNFFSLYQTE
jgi:hypothetical protein